MQADNLMKSVETPKEEAFTHPLMDASKVFLVKLPCKVHQSLMAQRATGTDEGKGKKSGVELGELRFDRETGECLMILGGAGKGGGRTCLKLNTEQVFPGTRGGAQVGAGASDILPDFEPGTMTVVGEKTKKGVKRLEARSQVSARLTGVQRNYHVQEEAKRGFFREDHVMVEKVEIPLRDQLNPYIYQLNDSNSDADDDESVASGDLLGKRKRVHTTLINKQPKQKRVSLCRNDLSVAIIKLFEERAEYRLQELQKRLNHPEGSLKNALRELCDFDVSKKIYTFKKNL